MAFNPPKSTSSPTAAAKLFGNYQQGSVGTRAPRSAPTAPAYAQQEADDYDLGDIAGSDEPAAVEATVSPVTVGAPSAATAAAQNTSRKGGKFSGPNIKFKLPGFDGKALSPGVMISTSTALTLCRVAAAVASVAPEAGDLLPLEFLANGFMWPLSVLTGSAFVLWRSAFSLGRIDSSKSIPDGVAALLKMISALSAAALIGGAGAGGLWGIDPNIVMIPPIAIMITAAFLLSRKTLGKARPLLNSVCLVGCLATSNLLVSWIFNTLSTL